MERIILKIKNQKKTNFLLELLKQFDFVEVLKDKGKTKPKSKQKYDFFSSAGLWSGRDVDADELRKKAWKK